MSGPKSYGYRVAEAALTAQREQRALQAAVARLATQHNAIVLEADHARDVYGNETLAIAPVTVVIDDNSTPEELKRVEGDLRASIEKDTARLHAQTATIARSLLGSGIEADVSDRVENVQDVLAQRDHQAIADDATGDPKSAIRRIVGRLDSRSPEDIETVRRAIATTLAATGPRTALALESLRVTVSRANDRERDRTWTQKRLEKLSCRLDGLDPVAVAAARERIATLTGRVLDEQAIENLETLVEQTARSAAAIEERRYAAAEIGRAFEDLGYSVSEHFATGIINDGYVDVANNREDWQGYAVRVRLPTDGSRIAFNLVRGAAWRVDQTAHDAEMERNWCQEISQLQSSIVGIELDARRLSAPGEVPVQQVEMPAPHVHEVSRRQQERQL